MSMNNLTRKLEKLNNENSLSKSALSFQSGKTDKSSKPLSVQTYINSRNNFEKLQNFISLEENLKEKPCWNEFKNAYDKLMKENNEITELYENEKKINEVIDEDNTLKINNDVFKARVLRIFSDSYNLKEYNLYPYFEYAYSEKKNSCTIKIYFNKAEFLVEDEKEPFSIIFLDDRDTYMTCFKEMPILFQKVGEEFNSVSLISEDFKYCIDFELTKIENGYETSFIFAEINRDLIETKNKIKELNNKKDSIQNKDEKIRLNKILESYGKILDSQTKLYSKKYIQNELEKKKNELIILEENLKIKELNIKENGKEEEEDKKKICKIKEEINKYEKSLKKITIKIQRYDKEFDGLFYSSEKITLKNTIGDELIIPAQSPIIVEVKNINRYKTIIENIANKKNLLNSLGFNTHYFYFVGIIRGIDINKENKQQINKIFNALNFKNIIVIYPEKLQFLNTPLIEIKIGINSEEKGNNNILNVVQGLMQKEFTQMRTAMDEMRKDYDSKLADMFEKLQKLIASLKKQ